MLCQLQTQQSCSAGEPTSRRAGHRKWRLSFYRSSTNHEHDFIHLWLVYGHILWPVSLSLFIRVNGGGRRAGRELLTWWFISGWMRTLWQFVILCMCVFLCVQVHHGGIDSDRKGLCTRPAGVHGCECSVTTELCNNISHIIWKCFVGGFSSGGRVGRPLIRRPEVRSPAPPLGVAKCLWLSQWTLNCPYGCASSEWGKCDTVLHIDVLYEYMGKWQISTVKHSSRLEHLLFLVHVFNIFFFTWSPCRPTCGRWPVELKKFPQESSTRNTSSLETCRTSMNFTISKEHFWSHAV